MKRSFFRIALMSFILFFVAIPGAAMATSTPFLNNGSGTSFNEQVNTWSSQLNSTAPTISFIMNAIFTIMFLFGVVRMGYAMITKTGQDMKNSMGIMIWVPIAVFSIRLLLLFMFTTTGKNVTLLANDIISLIQYIGYYLSIGMVLVGLLLFLFHRLINHPEFGRWSKRLWAMSGTLVLLVTVMPFVLGAA